MAILKSCYLVAQLGGLCSLSNKSPFCAVEVTIAYIVTSLHKLAEHSALNLLIQPQALLPLHTPRIPQHHIQALPPTKSHNMLNVQPAHLP